MIAPVQPHKLLVIHESMLTSMANNNVLISEFPFLKRLQQTPARRGCGRCGASNRQRAATFQAAKQSIANLTSERKLRLKQLLNAHQIRILYVRSDRRTVQMTF